MILIIWKCGKGKYRDNKKMSGCGGLRLWGEGVKGKEGTDGA